MQKQDTEVGGDTLTCHASVTRRPYLERMWAFQEREPTRPAWPLMVRISFCSPASHNCNTNVTIANTEVGISNTEFIAGNSKVIACNTETSFGGFFINLKVQWS